jgi:hypothetical protein
MESGDLRESVVISLDFNEKIVPFASSVFLHPILVLGWTWILSSLFLLFFSCAAAGSSLLRFGPAACLSSLGFSARPSTAAGLCFVVFWVSSAEQLPSPFRCLPCRGLPPRRVQYQSFAVTYLLRTRCPHFFVAFCVNLMSGYKERAGVSFPARRLTYTVDLIAISAAGYSRWCVR